MFATPNLAPLWSPPAKCQGRSGSSYWPRQRAAKILRSGAADASARRTRSSDRARGPAAEHGLRMPFSRDALLPPRRHRRHHYLARLSKKLAAEISTGVAAAIFRRQRRCTIRCQAGPFLQAGAEQGARDDAPIDHAPRDPRRDWSRAPSERRHTDAADGSYRGLGE